MATNCMRKLFNKGEYVFRQGDVPNQLCVILDGKIEIIREIVYSRCNRWPVGKLHMIKMMMMMIIIMVVMMFVMIVYVMMIIIIMMILIRR